MMINGERTLSTQKCISHFVHSFSQFSKRLYLNVIYLHFCLACKGQINYLQQNILLLVFVTTRHKKNRVTKYVRVKFLTCFNVLNFNRYFKFRAFLSFSSRHCKIRLLFSCAIHQCHLSARNNMQCTFFRSRIILIYVMLYI